MFSPIRTRTAALSLALAGCASPGEPSPFGSPTGGASGEPTTTSATESASATGSGSTSGISGTASASGASGPEPKFDVGSADLPGGGGACVAHTPCDAGTDDPFRAMGVGCPGELSVQTTIDAHPDGLMVLDALGQGATYAPTEGERFTILSTGVLPGRLWTEPTGPGDSLGKCNMWFSPGDGMDTSSFPPPIQANGVLGDCSNDPNLVGTGDCSNTIQGQFSQSGAKFDYQELRLSLTVPPGAQTLLFDVAYLTTEWPVFKDQPYNDMFIAWLESPTWSGNISFDAMNNPLSLNAAFLEFTDTNGDLPQFSGTCLRWHGGTRWLTTSAPVSPGQQIELVFAIFDLDDVNWDSMVLLDNLRWGCGDTPPGPTTTPEG